MPTVEEAICLGLLQGLTEFLPVSSSGHVLLAEMLLEVGRVDLQSPGRLALQALASLGALAAAVIFFRARLAVFARELGRCLTARRWPVPGSPGFDALSVLIVSLPASILALLCERTWTRWQSKPLVLGFGFIVTALALTSTLWARPPSRTSASPLSLLAMGIAQGCAGAPGLSRIAANSSAMLWLRLRAEPALELGVLSTLLPLATGAIVQLSRAGQLLIGAWPSVVAAGIMSLLAASLGLRLLRRALLDNLIAWFALWVLPLALATLALAKAWPH
jgi:undecaprenyl-diphosphatase